MSTPRWEPGTLYPKGSLVQPVTAGAPTDTTLDNPTFESGDSGWTKGTAWIITNAAPYNGAFAGSWCGYFRYTGSTTLESDIDNAAICAVAPGKIITGRAMANLDGPDSFRVRMGLRWLTAGDVEISESLGDVFIHETEGGWRQITVTGTAPATAAKVQLFARVNASAFSPDPECRVDAFSWDYATSAIPAGLVYQAVQDDTGTSGNEEPAWPLTLGVQVIDNEVTWEAVQASRVEWTAVPILLSDGTEPEWPTTPGEFVSDGTVRWECITRQVTDENCPNKAVAAFVAGHMFNGDDDIVRFNAIPTVPDWTTPQNAGFLPTGLQQDNANSVAVLKPYRGNNLAVWNANGFQLWQVDPDPAAMALLDQKPGLGSVHQHAACQVADDLLFLSQLGVRSVSVTAGTGNLVAGDVGQPIDALVMEEVAAAVASGHVPVATYYPGAGQYWLATCRLFYVGSAVAGNLGDSVKGDVIAFNYVADNGVPPYTYAISDGALPTGLSMNASGVVSGTTTVAGDFAWTVQATDGDGNTARLHDTCEVTTIVASGEPPIAEIDVAYSFTFESVGGRGAVTWTKTSGTLQAGLSFSSAGVLSGTPTASGSAAIQVMATDANGNTSTVDFVLRVTVLPKLLSGFSRWKGSLAALTGAVDHAIYVDDDSNGTPKSGASRTGRFLLAMTADSDTTPKLYEFVNGDYTLLTITGTALPTWDSQCFSPNEEWCFITAGNSIYAYEYDGTGFTHRATYATGIGSGGAIGCSDNFRIARSGSSARMAVWQFNTDTYAFTLLGQSSATVTAGQNDRNLEWSPNGRWIAGGQALTDTKVYDTNSYPMAAVTIAQSSTHGAFWSADGLFLYLAAATMRVCSFDGLALTSLATIAYGTANGAASINSARTHIALHGNSNEIRVFSIAGSTMIDLGNVDTGTTSPQTGSVLTNLTEAM